MVSYGQVIDLIRSWPKDFVAFVGAGGENLIYSIYWPLFIYFIFQSQLDLGIFASVVTLLAAAASLVLGKRTDHRHQSRKYQKIGISSFGLSWLGKSLWQHPLALSLFDIVHRLFNPFFVILIVTTALYHAQRDSISSYITFREVGYRLGYILAVVLTTVILIYLPFWTVFILAAGFSVLPLKLKP